MRPHDDLIEPTPGLPLNFDPGAYPVLAKHWFGLTVLPRPANTSAREAADVRRAA